MTNEQQSSGEQNISAPSNAPANISNRTTVEHASIQSLIEDPKQLAKARIIRAINDLDRTHCNVTMKLRHLCSVSTFVELVATAQCTPSKNPIKISQDTLAFLREHSEPLSSVIDIINAVSDEASVLFWQTILSPQQTPIAPPPKVIPFRDANHTEVTFGQRGYRWNDLKESKRYEEEGGWKLHLTVDPHHYVVVDQWLYQHHRGQYKLLEGGGHSEGSDFTIYIGSMDDALKFAQKIEGDLGHLLDVSPPEQHVDRPLTQHVTGRFDIGKRTKGKGNLGLTEYGTNGIPSTEKFKNQRDIRNLKSVFLTNTGTTATQRKEALATYREELRKDCAHIDQMLQTEFGEYYTGKKA